MKMDGLRFIGASTVDFPLQGTVESGPFVLKSAEGLGPPEITVKMAKTVLEKGLYQGKTPALRQVIALVGLQPDWNEGQTPEQLRTQLYSLLTPKYGALLRMEVRFEGVTQAYCEGQISAMMPALFTKDPAVQIVLDCDYAYLLGPDEISQVPTQRTVGGLKVFDVENDGTAPAGFKMGVYLGAATSTLILSEDDAKGRKIQIDGIDWAINDKFIVDTRAGSRGVWRAAGTGPPLPILGDINGQVTEWIELHGGDNTLKLNVSAFTFDPTYNFVHRPAYWGV